MKCMTKIIRGLTLDADSIRHGLESLPQELYDQIYLDVFTAPPGVRNLTNPKIHCERHEKAVEWCKVDQKRKARRRLLNPLHVSKSTRELYAESFYRGHFHFDTRVPVKTYYKERDQIVRNSIYCKWLIMLPKQHKFFIRRITVSADATNHSADLRHATFDIAWSMSMLMDGADIHLETMQLKTGSLVHYCRRRGRGVVVINPKFCGYDRELAREVRYEDGKPLPDID